MRRLASFRFTVSRVEVKQMDSRKVVQPRFEIETLEERIAPAIVLVNPAGNTPQSDNANNGQAIENQNPAGHAPPGHN
jgi:hypothetical protein